MDGRGTLRVVVSSGTQALALKLAGGCVEWVVGCVGRGEGGAGGGVGCSYPPRKVWNIWADSPFLAPNKFSDTEGFQDAGNTSCFLFF